METRHAPIERSPRIFWLLVLAELLLLPQFVHAQGLRPMVDAALDQKITPRIEISERPLRDALHALEQPTGLRFELHPAAIELMPYGEQTRLAIVIEDLSVREALGRIFDGLGLALRVEGDKVLVEPAPVLDRLGRPLTIEEVQLLQRLAAGPWSPPSAGEVRIQFELPEGPDYRRQLERALQDAAPASAVRQLEAATQRCGWLWVPDGGAIVVFSRSAEIQQRLDRPQNVYYRQIPLDELLLDLGRRIGMTVRFEPGALDRVAARDRHVDLIQRDITARQVLELIVGRTGLWYEVEEDGIVVGAAPHAAESAAGPQRQPVVAIVRIRIDDEKTVEFLLRANELPPEFAKLRDRKLPEIIEILRERLGE